MSKRCPKCHGFKKILCNDLRCKDGIWMPGTIGADQASPVPCQTCNGYGFVVCDMCDGKGEI